MDVAALRADTPGCLDKVFLDNAGSALPPTAVIDAVCNHLRLESEIGGYRAAISRSEDREELYLNLASLLNCLPSECHFVESATHGFLRLLNCIPVTSGQRIIVHDRSYGPYLTALGRFAAARGCVVDVHHSLSEGRWDIPELERSLARGRTSFIVASLVPNYSGEICDMSFAAEAARTHGVPFIVDACQGLGQLNIDVGKIPCDALVASGRKFLRGPRGSGILFVRSSTLGGLLPDIIDGEVLELVHGKYVARPGARIFEVSERSVAIELGLGAAVKYALNIGLTNIESRTRALGVAIRAMLIDVPGVSVWENDRCSCAIATFSLRGFPAEAIVDELASVRISVDVARIPDSLADAATQRPACVVRTAPHYFNTIGELELLSEGVRSLATKRCVFD